MQTPVEVLHSIVDSDIAKGTCSSFKEEDKDCRHKMSWSVSCAVVKSIMGEKLLSRSMLARCPLECCHYPSHV